MNYELLWFQLRGVLENTKTEDKEESNHDEG